MPAPSATSVAVALPWVPSWVRIASLAGCARARIAFGSLSPSVLMRPKYPRSDLKGCLHICEGLLSQFRRVSFTFGETHDTPAPTARLPPALVGPHDLDHRLGGLQAGRAAHRDHPAGRVPVTDGPAHRRRLAARPAVRPALGRDRRPPAPPPSGDGRLRAGLRRRRPHRARGLAPRGAHDPVAARRRPRD